MKKKRRQNRKIRSDPVISSDLVIKHTVYVEVFYVMSKVLSGELSCMQTGLIFKYRYLHEIAFVYHIFLVTPWRFSPFITRHLGWFWGGGGGGGGVDVSRFLGLIFKGETQSYNSISQD